MSTRREAVVHAGPVHILVMVRDLSSSGLLVEAELMLEVGERAVLEHDVVAGDTPVRVVRHTTSSGKLAMGLEVLWDEVEPAAREGSGLFAFVGRK